MMEIFVKKHEDDTIMDRLGAAKESSPGGFWMVLILTIAMIVGFFYFNFTAMGLATGAEKSLVPHGLAYVFLQPFYSFWSIYYVLIGHKKSLGA